MNVETPDRDLLHLFPPFREKLQKAMAEISVHTGDNWIVVEGYRSPERQLWLYEQGRTRQGPIVTWMRHPLFHGKGLAADIMPGRHGYKCPAEWWHIKQYIIGRHGLVDPVFERGDKGHCQLDLDAVGTAAAVLWVKDGFR